MRRISMVYGALGLAAAMLLATPAVIGVAAQEGGAELGGSVFAANCAACHGDDGSGIPGAFPPLAGHLPDIASSEGGREYLVRVVLFGMQGPIEVAGTSYDGLMPGWRHLSDEQIAAVLNHELTSWGNGEDLPGDFQEIGAQEVASARAEELSTEEVYGLRGALEIGAPEADLRPDPYY